MGYDNWVRDIYTFDQAFRRVIEQEAEISALRKIIKSLGGEDKLFKDGLQHPDLTAMINKRIELEGLSPRMPKYKYMIVSELLFKALDKESTTFKGTFSEKPLNHFIGLTTVRAVGCPDNYTYPLQTTAAFDIFMQEIDKPLLENETEKDRFSRAITLAAAVDKGITNMNGENQ